MDYCIGAIDLFGFNYAPNGFALCDGGRLDIRDAGALYNLIGSTYGGDGVTYFLLPNLTDMSPIPGMNYYINVNGLYPSRQ